MAADRAHAAQLAHVNFHLVSDMVSDRFTGGSRSAQECYRRSKDLGLKDCAAVAELPEPSDERLRRGFESIAKITRAGERPAEVVARLKPPTPYAVDAESVLRLY